MRKTVNFWAYFFVNIVVFFAWRSLYYRQFRPGFQVPGLQTNNINTAASRDFPAGFSIPADFLELTRIKLAIFRQGNNLISQQVVNHQIYRIIRGLVPPDSGLFP
jgi:hypothetical protein